MVRTDTSQGEGAAFFYYIYYMKVFWIIFFLTLDIISKGQEKDKSSAIKFKSSNTMIVYLDSSGHFEMSQCWEKIESTIIVDVFSNHLITVSTNSVNDEFISVKKISAYKLTLATMVNFSGINKKNGVCGIRLSLPSNENLFKYYTYLYIDYKDVTYVYQMLAQQ